MKKIILHVLGGLAVSGALFSLVYLIDQADAYIPPAPDIGPDYAFLVQIPPPLTPRDVTSSLFCPRIEARSGKLILATLWAKLPATADNKIIYAHTQAYNFGGSVGWVMLVMGPRIWTRVIKEVIDRAAAQDAGAKMSGPFPLASLSTKAPLICNGIASKFLIKLTGQQEAGLPPGPTDAGTWPPEEVLACSDGTKYQLVTSMNGYQLSSMNWTTLPPLTSWKEAPAGPLEFLPCSTTWKDPDAALWKTCPPVSVGTACP